MGDEYWGAVAGYPNYLVSRRGEVRSLVRGKLLAQVVGKRGYLLVNLYRDGRAKNFLVHRLVAGAFIRPIPPGLQVNHKDGDKRNNDLGNLEFVTLEQNRAHAARHRLLRVGEANPSAPDGGGREGHPEAPGRGRPGSGHRPSVRCGRAHRLPRLPAPELAARRVACRSKTRPRHRVLTHPNLGRPVRQPLD